MIGSGQKSPHAETLWRGNQQWRPAPVTIEYDDRRKRVKKMLPDSFKAREFYAAKHKAGKRPEVVLRLISDRLKLLPQQPVSAPRQS